MNTVKSLAKETALYGLATVLPRVFSFILIPVYTQVMKPSDFGILSIVFSYFVFFNVLLSYGMETSFFRFFTKSENPEKVKSTATLSLFWSSLGFLALGVFFQNTLSGMVKLHPSLVVYALWILAIDALSVVPFAALRAKGKALYYTFVKVSSVAINLSLTVFFLIYLPKLAAAGHGFALSLYTDQFQVGYILIANIISSLFALIALSKHYFTLAWHFDFSLWKQMIKYSFPILLAGIAFAINEAFDRLFLDWLLPTATAKADVGAYSACYKIALFMTLFSTAFRLGIEPFFFRHAAASNNTTTYAKITEFFVSIGSLILIWVIVFADVLKWIMIRDESYWYAMKIVPLIILANLFLGMYHNLSVWYKITDKTKMGAYISIFGAVITVVLNIFLIPIIGIMGSATATVLAYGSMMLLSYILGQKYFPIPYNRSKIIIQLMASVVLSGVYFYFFRDYFLVGVLFAIGFSFYLYKQEKPLLLAFFKK